VTTPKTAEERIHAYQRAYTHVQTELSEQPIALRVSGYRSDRSKIELLFEPAADHVFGQVRVSSQELEAAGNRLRDALESYGFVTITSHQPTDVPEPARQYDAFLESDEPDEVRFVGRELPKNDDALARMTEELTSLVYPHRRRYDPSILILVPADKQTKLFPHKAWPLFPKGYLYADAEMIIGAGEEAGEEAAAAAPPVVDENAPRSAYALLATEDIVVAQAPFDLTVGISPTPTPEVQGDTTFQLPALERWPLRPHDSGGCRRFLARGGRIVAA
jgi:hypothetical protein